MNIKLLFTSNLYVIGSILKEHKLRYVILYFKINQFICVSYGVVVSPNVTELRSHSAKALHSLQPRFPQQNYSYLLINIFFKCCTFTVTTPCIESRDGIY